MSWPDPSGPRWTTGSAKLANTGWQYSTVSGSPPAITSRRPSAAAGPPPLTGAFAWRADAFAAQTEEILLDLGLDWDRIIALKEAGAVT